VAGLAAKCRGSTNGEGLKGLREPAEPTPSSRPPEGDEALNRRFAGKYGIGAAAEAF
jgi:hypothetical protein